MKTEEDKIYISSFEIRKRLHLPITISSLLNVFEVSINDQNGNYNSFFATTNQQLFDINIELQKAFLKFTKAQKILHYAYCVQFLKTVIENRLIQDRQQYKKYLFEKKCMEVRGYQKPSMLSLWQKILVVVNFDEKSLTLVHKIQQKYNLKYYFMRQSKDPAKFSLIFESITPLSQKSSIRVGFDSKNFFEVKIKLKRLMEQLQKQRLFAELKKSISADSIKTSTTKNQLTYLNKQVINNFKMFSQQVRQRPQINLVKTELFRSSSKIINCVQGVYFLQQIFLMKKQSLMQSLRVSPTKWHSLVKESVIVEKLETSKLQAVFYKFLFNDRTYQSIVAIQQNNTQNQGFILYQTLQNSESKDAFRLDYMILRVVKVNEQISRLTIQTRIITGDESNQQFAIQYLMEYSNLVQVQLKSEKILPYRKRQSYTGNVQIDIVNPPTAEQTVYIDALGGSQDLDDINEDIDTNSNQNYHSQPEYVFYSESKEEKESGETHGQITLKNLIYTPKHPQTLISPLNYKHAIHPLAKDQPLRLTSHYLDVQWRRSKIGTLINTNQQVLNEQKKVARHLLTTFGKNILKVKGFLNISLPVTVCSKRSHLQLIAYNYAYAPLILEPYSNVQPLERMKRLLIFNLAVASTGIAGGSQKPFNPILGQTYQGTVNGCNIYLQQISHHPAISAYFFEGRGFKCYGSIQPKIEITGLNSGRGYSERDHKIEFDDGTLVYLTYPRMFAKGFLFGDRQFNFDSKNIVFDTKNLLFAQIHYGPKKTSFFGGTDDPYDLVYGKIYKVKPSFLEYFKAQKNKAFPQKDHIVSELATFEGLWTGIFKINGVQFYNFLKELPIVLQDYPAPLPSHSNFRLDLLKLIQGDVNGAQQQKQKGQDIQRKDKNLRQKAKQKRNKKQ